MFWGEIAPSEHMVQFYEREGVFLDTLEGFAGGGLKAGEAVIIIATPSHLEALERRLSDRGVDLQAAAADDRYIAIDAAGLLERFMVDQWPDDGLFEEVVDEVLARAKGDGRRVRAFGEMVAILWSQGHSGATVRLEHLWHRLCQERQFSLFCAYPRIGFTQDAESSIRDICEQHTRFLEG